MRVERLNRILERYGKAVSVEEKPGGLVVVSIYSLTQRYVLEDDDTAEERVLSALGIPSRKRGRPPGIHTRIGPRLPSLKDEA